MTVSRASRLGSNLGRIILRRPGAQPRTQAWRQAVRRQYATEHGKKSSELPWMIGSVALTAPAAFWLWNQGPDKSAHHGHEAHDEGKEEDKEPAPEGEDDSSGKDEEKATDEKKAKKSDKKDEKPDKKDEKSDKKGEKDDKSKEKKDDKSKDKGEDKSKDKSKSKSKSDDSESGKDDESSDGGDEKDTPPSSDDSGSDDDGYEKPSSDAPGQINYKPGMGKSPGEGQKDSRSATEKKGEKDAAKDQSGAQHPYLDDPEKSKKGEGLTETAKIHGTVDSNRPAR